MLIGSLDRVMALLSILPTVVYKFSHFHLTLLQSLYPYVCMYVCMYTSMHVYMIVIIDWVWYHV